MTRALVIEGSVNLWGLSARSLICSMPYNGRMSALIRAFLWCLAWKRFARTRSIVPKLAAGGARTTVNVLPTGASLLPEYRGPAFSVSRLAMAKAEAGAEVVKIEPGRSKARLEREG